MFLTLPLVLYGRPTYSPNLAPSPTTDLGCLDPYPYPHPEVPLTDGGRGGNGILLRVGSDSDVGVTVPKNNNSYVGHAEVK